MKFRNFSLNLDKALIMGVLNVTPDSFSDGGPYLNADKAVEHAKKMAKDGADIIDIGAESSRPGTNSISEEEELQRIIPIVKGVISEISLPVSIDTYKPKVAEECLKLGAHIINDISGLANNKMVQLVAEYRVPAVIMHMQGTPKSMQANPQYNDVVNDIKKFLNSRISVAKKMGVNDIIIDPGIGFGKTTLHNLQILKRLNEFKELGCPILIGPSRKSFIGSINGLEVSERLEGTLASIAIGIMNGADIVRVHDVKECSRAAQIAYAVKNS